MWDRERKRGCINLNGCVLFFIAHPFLFSSDPVKSTNSGVVIGAIIVSFVAAAELVVILYLIRGRLREIFNRCTGRTGFPAPA